MTNTYGYRSSRAGFRPVEIPNHMARKIRLSVRSHRQSFWAIQASPSYRTFDGCNTIAHHHQLYHQRTLALSCSSGGQLVLAGRACILWGSKASTASSTIARAVSSPQSSRSPSVRYGRAQRTYAGPSPLAMFVATAAAMMVTRLCEYYSVADAAASLTHLTDILVGFRS